MCLECFDGFLTLAGDGPLSHFRIMCLECFDGFLTLAGDGPLSHFRTAIALKESIVNISLTLYVCQAFLIKKSIFRLKMFDKNVKIEYNQNVT